MSEVSNENFDSNNLVGKIVLVGATDALATELKDSYSLPAGRQISGVELQGYIVASILRYVGVEEEIVIISIDKDRQFYDKLPKISGTLRRSVYAALVERLLKTQPKVVGIDVYFAEKIAFNPLAPWRYPTLLFDGIFFIAVLSYIGRNLMEKPLPIGNFFWTVTEQATLARFVNPKSKSVHDILDTVRQRREKGFSDDTPVAVAKDLYNWLKDEVRIIYEYPPVEPGKVAQRIRCHEEVIEEKVGTCLDLAALFAACLEGAQQKAVIIHYMGQQEGSCDNDMDKSYAHAVCGFWTTDDSFSGDKPYCEDVSEFRRKVNSGSLCLVECISFSLKDGKEPESFSNATSEAKDYALGKLPKSVLFNFALDIKMARYQGIIPM